MVLNRVTITGADDSIDPKWLIPLTKEFPFVEWGILLSSSQEGANRFPSFKWLKKLFELRSGLCISGHLCGSWVRKICLGEPEFFKIRSEIVPMFSRFQLNFHSYTHTINKDPFIRVLTDVQPSVQFIFQLDDVNNSILDIARSAGISAVPLFDLSGGAGVLPKEWPKARDCYSGYAGGLSPDNVVAQLNLIKKVADQGTIWIDVETHVRSNNDQDFDLKKVRKFLTAVQPWVTHG